MKDAPISIRLESDLREALKQLAANESRTLSDYIRLTLFRHVQDAHQAHGKVFRDHTPPRKRDQK
jgi:predicted DNA-binding protein